MRPTGIMLLCILAASVDAGPAWAVDGGSSHDHASSKHDAKGEDKLGEGEESPGIARTAPRQVGNADPTFWGHLTEDQEVEAVAKLKAFAQKSAEGIKHPLRLHEGKFYLFYSDLQENEAARYAGLLDRMYGQLAEFFGVDKGQTLWRGKALVLVLSKVEDYRLYERLMEDCDAGGSYAMTQCYGDGMVHMAFYRYPNEIQFTHLLVHESVHGFLHRYRTPARIPSWANEGLADELASELIPDPRRAHFVNGLIHTGLAQHHNALGDFFTVQHIDGWQYPVAETLCAWMIRQNRKGYLDFINGIKDGQGWEESLKANYKMGRDQLLTEYAKAMKLKSLKI